MSPLFLTPNVAARMSGSIQQKRSMKVCEDSMTSGAPTTKRRKLVSCTTSNESDYNESILLTPTNCFERRLTLSLIPQAPRKTVKALFSDDDLFFRREGLPCLPNMNNVAAISDRNWKLSPRLSPLFPNIVDASDDDISDDGKSEKCSSPISVTSFTVLNSPPPLKKKCKDSPPFLACIASKEDDVLSLNEGDLVHLRLPTLSPISLDKESTYGEVVTKPSILSMRPRAVSQTD